MSWLDFLPFLLVCLIPLGYLAWQQYTGELWRSDDD